MFIRKMLSYRHSGSRHGNNQGSWQSKSPYLTSALRYKVEEVVEQSSLLTKALGPLP